MCVETAIILITPPPGARDNTSKEEVFMAPKKKPVTFDPKSFLAKIGTGRTITEYQKKATIFAQGDPADAIFYIQQGKVKLSVVSKQGKVATVAILGEDDFFGEASMAGHAVRM